MRHQIQKMLAAAEGPTGMPSGNTLDLLGRLPVLSIATALGIVTRLIQLDSNRIILPNLEQARTAGQLRLAAAHLLQAAALIDPEPPVGDA